MLFSLAAVSSLLALGANAVVHDVKVGAGGLVFDPAEISGVVAGDEIAFSFIAKNHTVTQSTFAEPCKAKPNGINSGFMAAPADQPGGQPTYTIIIKNETEPLWFYCRQKTPADHCAAGMVFSVNPTAEKSHAAFVEKAKAGASAAPAASSGAPPAGAAPTDANAAAASGSTTATAGSDTVSPTSAAALAGQPNSARSVMTGSMASVLAVVGVVATFM